MRIRTIKPAFWTSDDIIDLPDDFTRLLFIGLWNYADDEGRGRDRAALIVAALFPLREDITAAHVEVGMTNLACAGLITRYIVEDRWYFVVAKWGQHQRISHPSGSILPSPEDGSSVPPGTVQETSITVENGGKEDSGWEVEQGSGREQGTGSPALRAADQNGNGHSNGHLAASLLAADSTAQYLLGRLDEGWQEAVTPAVLMKLGNAYGPEIVTDALRNMRESQPDPDDHYPYLESACKRLFEVSA